MMLWRLGSLLSVLMLALASSSSDAQCTSARVRRSWSSLSSADRQLYKDAVAASMDSGAYIKFVEIHTEMMSEMEAHRQCMFVYWHRLFLTAFENMLRGQGARFACVTVPYWDWLTDYSRYATGQCSSILGCSPALSYLGNTAPVSSGVRTVTINGDAVSGYCEADAPMNHFCESSQVSGRRCAKCVPRANWARVRFPASASFASVRAQLFGAATIGEMSTAIEQGVHNNIHAELGATMATFESPADPVFWSHHATVDMLHSIFHKCKVGEQKLTFAQKASSVSWSSCERRNGGVFNPTDYITMRTGYLGRNAINATRDSIVGRYFSAVPQQFAALVDIRDLGASSYSYEPQGLLGSLYTTCGATSTVRRLEDEVAAGSTAGSASASGDATIVAPAPVNASATPTPPSMGAMINATTEPAAQKVHGWVNNADKMVKRRGGNAVLEAEKMACLFQDECLGGVSSYTAEFKKRFGVKGEPRCRQIVDRINRKADSVKVTEWKTQMIQTFGCPQPKNGAASTSNPAAQTDVTPLPTTAAPATTAPPVAATPCPNAAKAAAQANAEALAYAKAYGPASVAPPAATVSAGNANGGSYVNLVGQRAAK